ELRDLSASVLAARHACHQLRIVLGKGQQAGHLIRVKQPTNENVTLLFVLRELAGVEGLGNVHPGALRALVSPSHPLSGVTAVERFASERSKTARSGRFGVVSPEPINRLLRIVIASRRGGIRQGEGVMTRQTLAARLRLPAALLLAGYWICLF